MSGGRSGRVWKLGVAASVLAVVVVGCSNDDPEPETKRACAAVQPSELSDLADTKLDLPRAWVSVRSESSLGCTAAHARLVSGSGSSLLQPTTTTASTDAATPSFHTRPDRPPDMARTLLVAAARPAKIEASRPAMVRSHHANGPYASRRGVGCAVACACCLWRQVGESPMPVLVRWPGARPPVHQLNFPGGNTVLKHLQARDDWDQKSLGARASP